MGQGSIFFAQSLLLWQGNSAFIGLFGLSYTLNTLAYQITDWGSIVVLSRHVLSSENSKHDIRMYYWSLSWLRLLVALILSASTVGAALITGHEFAIGYAASAAAGLLVYAFNSGGLLDGAQRSGWTGLSVAIPAAFTGLALPFASYIAPLNAGLLAGSAYTLGTILSVLLMQHLATRAGIAVGRPAFSMRHARTIAAEGGLFLLSILPGQFFYRGQLAIGGLSLGAAGLGYLVYAKQITNVGFQFLYFVRRVEFPRLVSNIERNDQTPMATILGTQRITIALSIAGTLGLLALGGLIFTLAPLSLRPIGIGLASFSSVIFCGGLFSIMNQACAAYRQLRTASIAAFGMLASGLLLCWLLSPLGVLGLAIAESAATFAAAAAMATALTLRYKSLNSKPSDQRT